MDISLFIVSISYILIAASWFTIPLRRKRSLNESGKIILGFPKKNNKFVIFVEILSVFLVTILFFIRYGAFVSVVLCGCGVLGAWIVVGEAALGKYYGLYENGIIAVGKYIPYDDIMTFPVLNLPKNEQLNHPQNVLVIASRRYGNVEIAFESDEVCSEVISTLRKMHIIK